METENIYHQPIDLNKVTSIQTDSIAHIGDLIHSIDYDAPEGTPIYAAFDGVVIAVKDDSNIGGLERMSPSSFHGIPERASVQNKKNSF